MTTTQIAVKHPQSILAMDTEFFFGNPDFTSNINQTSAEEWIKNVQPFLIIGQRNRLETTPRYRQLLPYVIVRQIGEDGVLRYQPYRRTSGVGESRLAGNISIGYGGHVDMADCYADNQSILMLQMSLAIAVEREIREEIIIVTEDETNEGFEVLTTFADLFILDDSNDVGRVHLGIVMYCDIPTGIKITTKEDELVSMAPMTLDELLESQLPLENWTRIFLENVKLTQEEVVV